MKMILFFLAGFSMAAWGVGCFLLKAGIFIHVLVIVALILFLRAVIINPRPHN